MYILEEMIELGLDEGQVFPSADHRIVAVTLGINVGGIDQKDDLHSIVQAVCKVPADRIRTVTVLELVDEFGMDVRIYHLNS